MVACLKPVKLSKILFKPLYIPTAILLTQKVKFLLKGEKDYPSLLLTAKQLNT